VDQVLTYSPSHKSYIEHSRNGELAEMSSTVIITETKTALFQLKDGVLPLLYLWRVRII
jgi:hypothetical protein